MVAETDTRILISLRHQATTKKSKKENLKNFKDYSHETDVGKEMQLKCALIQNQEAIRKALKISERAIKAYLIKPTDKL